MVFPIRYPRVPNTALTRLRAGPIIIGPPGYSTVTLLARLRGLSTLQPRRTAAW
jgi:hypothetical protein